ncbi:zinc-binding dehydrogenase [Aciduricibacillus chroicocephali]|uniref:Zinc-binding dehydrogenase n=1 Tax=Aciduricibacillus chroicocephali TaxID=3054939 RepID=A0ABY9KYZ6_9BACI|nr:zinc-binding dehydrogenase [Bacillaceae bacterium 44XB]
MKAYVHDKNGCNIKEMPEPQAGEGEVVVRIKYAGLNRRDLYIPGRRGDNPDSPLILGSDGAGVIETVGFGVSDLKQGDEVLINPSLRWKKNSPAPPAEFDILGMPDHGTFAEKIVLSADQIEKIPEHLTMKEAAVVALAGTTGYRAMFTKGRLQRGETVLIPGAGSGVATFLIQFAKKIGARVIVSSRSKEKRERALAIGADLAIDTHADWEQELADEKIDLVIDSVGRATFNKSLAVLKKGGRIVVFGATTEDKVEFDLRTFFYNQQEIIGSTMGSREELRDMLELMEKYNIHPEIDGVLPIDEAEVAFEKLHTNHQFGKLVLEIE